jgi:hypothetical protein
MAGTPTPPVEIRLTEGRALRGVVKDAAGKPIAGAEIAAIEVDVMSLMFPRSQRTATGADGRFSYATFGTGDIGLVVRAAGHAPTTMGNLRAGGKDVEVVLEKAVRIEGRVFDVATGNGLAGASVVAVSMDREVGIGEARTAPDGTYLIEDGPAGSGATVIAKLAGWVMARHAHAAEDEDAADADFGEEPSDELQAGTTVRRDIAMVAGGRVSGRVLDAATGEGVAGAEVVAIHRGTGFLAFSEPVSARSGPDGAFVLPPIGAGKVTLRAWADGYDASENAPGSGEEQAEPEVRGTEVDVRVGAAVTGVVVRLRRGHEIDVLVSDPEGTPVPGAVVSWVGPEEHRFELFGASRRPRTVATDAVGKARMTGVPRAAGILLAARHPDGRSSGHATADAPASPGSVTRIVVVPGASVAGVLLDASGHPASGHLIAIASDDSVDRAFREWDSQGATCATDRSGRFLIENVRPGSATVRVSPLKSLDDEDPHVSEVPVDPSTFDLESGKRLEVTLRLVRTESISGTVYDAAGKPLENVPVRAAPAGASSREGEETWVQTGLDGRFTIPGLRSGTYRLEAFRQSEGGNQSEAKTVASGSTSVEIRFAQQR